MDAVFLMDAMFLMDAVFLARILSSGAHELTNGRT